MKKILVALSIFLPSIAAAAGGTKLEGFMDTLLSAADTLYKVIVVGVFIAFAWGILNWIFRSGDDSSKGKSIATASLIGMFILLSIYGIVFFFQDAIGIDGSEGTNVKIPGIDVSGEIIKTS